MSDKKEWPADFAGWLQAGFESGCVDEDAILFFMVKGPRKMLDFENLLYPACASEFENALTIKPQEWEWIQNRAAEILEKEAADLAPNVKNHLLRIVAGDVPFGVRVSP